MAQAPTIAVPLKVTNEIDWISPLKSYIQHTYGDDPERYAEECVQLDRLRQDMRGAVKDSTSGRDLLYRYYGQLELLDLRFPVDEKNIKITFTWFDAFTHKATSQHSLAFEKASIIFNISAVLSCYAAAQTRSEESSLKIAYHSFQASAGMFAYINENFLHAPSSDLSRETVKTLINIMLAQAQEVFLEKQVADQKKVGLLAKLASQAAALYTQAQEGVSENVQKAIFEKVWLLMVQAKQSLMASMAQYYQAQADDDANSHGIAIARLEVAGGLARDAVKTASQFPSTIPPASGLAADCGTIMTDIAKRQLAAVQAKLKELNKDNDFIYHQLVPAASNVQPVPKLLASKPIPVSELFSAAEIQRITGPDLFSRIVPLAVTESASVYDEQKAKLIRAETERVDAANSELAASLDYLRLPGALQVLKGGFDQDTFPDEDFRTWCDDVADHETPASIFETLASEKRTILLVLDRSTKSLDMEESVCEKMRSKYAKDWIQQPSSRLTTTLRKDIKNYREALDEAARSDGLLAAKLQRNEGEFEEMRAAAHSGEIEGLFQRAMAKAGGTSRKSISLAVAESNLLDEDFEPGPSVAEQIVKVEDILKKLNQVRKERDQVLRDMKDQAHNDDIAQILILNKKSVQNFETTLFPSELAKYRPYQNRLSQANHKQSTLMKELTVTFNTLLQDKRVRSEQNKFETVQRRQATAINKYKRAYQEFLDLEAGLQSAKAWYKEMRDTVDSLEKNIDTFVNNRRSEGAHLLNQIEQAKTSIQSAQAAMEQKRLRGLMERMSMEPPACPANMLSSRPSPAPLSFGPVSPAVTYPKTSFFGQYQLPSSPHSAQTIAPPQRNVHQQSTHSIQSNGGYDYNPGSHGRIAGPASPPAHHTNFHVGRRPGPASPPPTQSSFSPQPQPSRYGMYSNLPSNNQQTLVPPGFVPPPPPPGPPPLGPQQTVHYEHDEHYLDPSGLAQGGQHQLQHPLQAQTGQDGNPWAGLSAWK